MRTVEPTHARSMQAPGAPEQSVRRFRFQRSQPAHTASGLRIRPPKKSRIRCGSRPARAVWSSDFRFSTQSPRLSPPAPKCDAALCKAQLRTPPAEPTSERRHRPPPDSPPFSTGRGVKHAGPARFVRSVTRTGCPPRMARAACNAPATAARYIPQSSSCFAAPLHHRDCLHHGDCKG